MKSKRFKKLPEKTNRLNPETIEKLLLTIKQNFNTNYSSSYKGV